MDDRPTQLLDRLAPDVDVAAARRVFESRARRQKRARRLASAMAVVAVVLPSFAAIRAAVTRQPSRIVTLEPPVSAPVASPEGAWKLVSGISGADAANITLVVRDSEISGDGGCNGYGGDIELGANGGWTSAGVNRTEMGCEHARAEAAYFAAFDRVRSFEVTDGGSTLVLRGDGGELRFARDAAAAPPLAVPSTDSVLGTWQLVRVDVFRVPKIDPTTMVLTIDGSNIGGHLGCAEISGTLVGFKSRDSEGLAVGAIAPATCVDSEDGKWVPNLSNLLVVLQPDGALVLSAEEIGLRFTRVTASATPPLRKTWWTLVEVVDRDVVKPGLRSAYLSIDDDGTVTGSTGVGAIHGLFSAPTATTGRIESYRSDVEPAVDYIESAYANAGIVDAILGHEFTIQLQGTVLTISDPAGHTLRYSSSASSVPLSADHEPPAATAPVDANPSR
jgi:heat shock protein HslJ